MELEYRNINDMKWEQILRSNCRTWQSPMTVHLPIHPCHSPDWVIVDSALNVFSLPVFAGMSEEDKEKRKKNGEKNELMVVRFSLDEPPFVPDARFSNISLLEGRYPVALASYYAWDIHYKLEYFCQPLDACQSILWIRVTVENEDEKPRPVSVRANVSFLTESEALDMKSVKYNPEYAPLYSDAQQYIPCLRTSMDGERVNLDGRQVGRILPGSFAFEWEPEKNFSDENYNSNYNAAKPYFATPAMRYKNVRQAIRFSCGLDAGASGSFSIALFTDYRNITPMNLAHIGSAEPEKGRQYSVEHFKKQEKENRTEMQFPVQKWDDILFRMETSIRQMLLRPAGQKHLIPLQGGFNTRHWECVWEAMIMLRPMLQMGHFDIVRDALRFQFTLQDSKYAPKGKFVSIQGAIGSIGTPWLSTTGAALILASEYCRYSHDRDFMKQYLPAMFKAAGWIIGEIKATRKLDKNGSRPPYYGLMPFGMGTDGDFGYMVAKTDGFTYMGLAKFSKLLNELGHESAGEISKETEIYRKDIVRAVEGLVRSDGFIDRKIRTGGDKIHKKFEYISGAQQFFYTGVLDIDYKGFESFMDYWEKNVADGPFMGKMDREVVYIGNSEYYWQDIYIRQGEWKKAFLALQAFMKYGMTEKTFLLQERFSKTNPAYAPYQPNGSACGRLLEMMFKSFYFENGQKAVLLAGIPFAWLRDNNRTALKGLYLPDGRISVEASMERDDRCRLILSAERPEAMPGEIEIPGFFDVISTVSGVEGKNNLYSLLPGAARAEFIIGDARK